MQPPRFFSVSSTSPDLAAATDEVAAQLLASLQGAPLDALLVFASGSWTSGQDGLPDLGRRLRETTGTARLVGCTGAAVLQGSLELEDRPALAILAASLGNSGTRPLRLVAHREYGGGFSFDGLPDSSAPAGGLVLLGDPYSFPMPALLSELEDFSPGLALTGGMASGGSGPGEHLLWLDDETHAEGAVALALGPELQMTTAISQGCRPIGRPLVVTASQGNLILKLRGKPAAKVMVDLLEELEPETREQFQRGAFIGLALDATKSTFEPADFLVRNLMGFAPQQQAIAVASPELRTGMTVQFLVRDAASATDEFERILGEHAQRAGTPDPAEAAALLFTCGGRGRRMFGQPHHDVTLVQEAFGPDLPLAGFFANGEVGMVGGRGFLHGFTASLALIHKR